MRTQNEPKLPIKLSHTLDDLEDIFLSKVADYIAASPFKVGPEPPFTQFDHGESTPYDSQVYHIAYTLCRDKFGVEDFEHILRWYFIEICGADDFHPIDYLEDYDRELDLFFDAPHEWEPWERLVNYLVYRFWKAGEYYGTCDEIRDLVYETEFGQLWLEAGQEKKVDKRKWIHKVQKLLPDEPIETVEAAWEAARQGT